MLAANLHSIGNLIEAGFWIALGVGFGVFAVMKKAAVRVRCAIAGVALVVFGFSDVVERHTGAWYRPWWLFAWKAGCVAILGWLLWCYFRARQREMN